MLIILYLIIIKLLLPELGIFISAGIDGIMPDIITLIGIISIFSVFGITIFVGLGSAIVAALSKGIGFAGKSFFKGIAWVFRTIFSWIPKMHKSFKDALVRNGMSEIKAMLLSGVIVFVIILIIIWKQKIVREKGKDCWCTSEPFLFWYWQIKYRVIYLY